MLNTRNEVSTQSGLIPMRHSQCAWHDDARVDIEKHPFEVTDWTAVEETRHPGETGEALWRTGHLGTIRVRTVEYTPGYLADHWCEKGHVLLCVEGELHTELADGRTFTLTPGTSYQVGDNCEPHRSSTTTGARLFIVD
ncbi:MAG: hypothetical protein ACI8TP_001545 [Acidimicrobiales bacterium]|jgi:hypothetical protein